MTSCMLCNTDETPHLSRSLCFSFSQHTPPVLDRAKNSALLLIQSMNTEVRGEQQDTHVTLDTKQKHKTDYCVRQWTIQQQVGVGAEGLT